MIIFLKEQHIKLQTPGCGKKEHTVKKIFNKAVKYIHSLQVDVIKISSFSIITYSFNLSTLNNQHAINIFHQSLYQTISVANVLAIVSMVYLYTKPHLWRKSWFVRG